ncbi:hypothetical protein TWF506_004380 [Arthrobotrys conoides]|uniref:Uncharacterized protein n=1 Tax=Arthrobotrys conoides TaxID=74498 RepID=A0AAN8N6M7_9PEZI
MENFISDPGVSDHLKRDFESKKGPGLLYQVYQRKDVLGGRIHQLPVGKVGEPRFWHGCPQAAILHALRAVIHPSPGWIPDPIRDTYIELAKAWSLESQDGAGGSNVLPIILSNISEPSDEGSSENSGGRGNGGDDGCGSDHDHHTGNYDGQQETKANSSVISRNHNMTPRVDAQQSLTSYGSQQRIKKPNPWRYGPYYTSNDAVSLFSTVLHPGM